ncbi:alpha-mannosyltransferase KNAG_0G01060 [Huiozyma naganishii CBS 8797]|uniref:Alpha-1,3-mannosyltransferase n=1 Tax=Huiozyma naganishii (strain ATCC MYA-139 / BCRC 22969 / CBS 8797 / KCTC 17520 / NBRC 10181 / NCYC 3082 / Yp74L-3) TaxID=1071383 RepID=J7S7T3_HUIN7|nr:hypothetical protein KNAG_0G01060 [Kazachstania naganishii CBS 8797]CCK71164.1 hypothetical protein KNAG_0G01060 [Kazachstania naganishii CBS 8797]
MMFGVPPNVIAYRWLRFKTRKLALLVLLICTIAVTLYSTNLVQQTQLLQEGALQWSNRTFFPASTEVSSKVAFVNDKDYKMKFPDNVDLEHFPLAKPISTFHLTKKMLRVLKTGAGRHYGTGFLKFFGHKAHNKGKKNTHLNHQMTHVWRGLSRRQQCAHLINGLYYNSLWTNEDIMRNYENEGLGRMVFQMMAERLRVYDYCFLQESEDLNVVFATEPLLSSEYTVEDFNVRMFPFLQFSDDKLMWPDVIDVSEGVVLPPPNIEDMSIRDFNANFWANWAQYSEGKGIVLTMRESDSGMFYKQLNTFKELGNKLPIQVVTTGKEATNKFVETLGKLAKKTEQKIYLVDVSKLLKPDFVQDKIINFLNKWIATIFNTFEEEVFIDVDAISYVPMQDYFQTENYKDTGILMFRDRTLLQENTFKRCTDLLIEAEPTKEEVRLIGSRQMFDSLWLKKNDDVPDKELMSTEAEVYRNFYERLKLHHVDSGLIAIHKKYKLTGVLMSFFFNLDARLSSCVYGDKELFWLGQLVAGERFAINQMEGGILGAVSEEVVTEDDGKSKKVNYNICSTQIAHIDENNKLLWSNGGLRTCKFLNSAGSDFQSNEEYFASRYGDAETLQRVYDSPLPIDGVIIPDAQRDPWIQIKECANYVYCAFARTDSSGKLIGDGYLATFEDADRREYNEISKIWNNAELES